jgi:flagellar basal-body rod protein FlgF
MLDRFAYTAMTGAKHAMGQLGNTSHNLANAQTPGFREMVSMFRGVPIQGVSADSRSFVVDSTPGSNFSAGPVSTTGHALDVAIREKGFFVLQRPDGSEGYTRAGKFVIDQDGNLRGPGGFRVMGVDGPIVTDVEASDIQIQHDGRVHAKLPGDFETTLVGRLKLVNPLPHTLVREGDGLFTSPGGAEEPSDEVRVQQGALESSNVNVAAAMVEMIKQNRLFDLNLRMVQAAEQNAKSAGSLMSLARA